LGQIAILSDSYLVSNAVLGDPGSPPTQTQYVLYQKIFDFFGYSYGKEVNFYIKKIISLIKTDSLNSKFLFLWLRCGVIF